MVGNPSHCEANLRIGQVSQRGVAARSVKPRRIDAIDKGIIEALQRNGREPFRRIAAKLGVSEATIRARYARLVDDHILQVTGVTNPLGLGFESQAMVGVRTAGPPDPVADEIARWEEADYVVVTAGQFDILVEIVCGDRRDLLDVTNRIRALDGRDLDRDLPLPRAMEAVLRLGRPRAPESSAGGRSMRGEVGASVGILTEEASRHRPFLTSGWSVVKRFDDVIAVDGISLEIPHGTFFALLGPSGCGKTTTLRMIGGFEQADSGRIFLGGPEVAGLPPYKRDVNTVFQSYALFPHLTIFENVAFGLRRRGARQEARSTRRVMRDARSSST